MLILELTWDRVDSPGGRIVLVAQDTKSARARFTSVTARAKSALEALPTA